MSALKKYMRIHILFTVFIIAYILLINKELLQYACIIIVGLFAVFVIFVAQPAITCISNFLKNNYKEIYTRRSSGRKYAFKDLVAVNIFLIQESDLKTISDAEVINLVRELKLVFRIVFITTIVCIILLVIRAYV